MTSDFDVTDAADLDDFNTHALRTRLDGVAREQAAWMERELRGAWRAGYDYVHVYDEIGDEVRHDDTPDRMLSFNRAVLPTHDGDGRPSPPGYVYRFTYDLKSVPDETIRAAIRDGVSHED